MKEEYFEKKFYGSKLNTVLLIVLILLMVFALLIMIKNKDTYLPFFSEKIKEPFSVNEVSKGSNAELFDVFKENIELSIKKMNMQGDTSNVYRNLLIKAYEEPADFNDHYKVAIMSCGSGCASYIILDKDTGKIFDSLGLSNDFSSFQSEKWQAYYLDSNVISIVVDEGKSIKSFAFKGVEQSINDLELVSVELVASPDWLEYSANKFSFKHKLGSRVEFDSSDNIYKGDMYKVIPVNSSSPTEIVVFTSNKQGRDEMFNRCNGQNKAKIISNTLFYCDSKFEPIVNYIHTVGDQAVLLSLLVSDSEIDPMSVIIKNHNEFMMGELSWANSGGNIPLGWKSWDSEEYGFKITKLASIKNDDSYIVKYSHEATESLLKKNIKLQGECISKGEPGELAFVYYCLVGNNQSVLRYWDVINYFH